MVGRSDTVKVLDFGLAQVLEPISLSGGKEDETSTLGSGLIGTFRYMSPEQLRGEPLDHRTDLFSLGIILFELATGEHPFGTRTAADAIASILKDEPRSALELNPRLPRELDRILRHCLEKDVRLRIASAARLRDELEKLGQERRRPASGRSRPSPSSRSPT